MALKRCLKVHKLFLAEIERCERLEKEGEQVLSSLANVAQRLPLLVTSDADSDNTGPSAATGGSSSDAMVVLSYCGNTQSLLLQKHFLSLEKSMGFLNEVVKEYIDVIRRMKTFTSEYMDLLDCLESDDANSVVFPNQQLEWMEDVLRMFEREVLRKKILVADVEYHDAARLKQMHIQWGSKSVYSNVSHSYVQAGLDPLPLVPKSVSVAESTDASSSSHENSKVKSKKKKKKK